MEKNCEVYRDERYVLGRENGLPYIIIDGERYKLTCHPYEPCLYITDGSGFLTAVHNAFDPSDVLHAFSKGTVITSITGTEYDALDFCKMVEYASGRGNISISDAEWVFEGRGKKKNPEPQKTVVEEKRHFSKNEALPANSHIIEKDSFYDLIARYPDSVVDFCLVKNEDNGRGRNAHWYALVRACQKIFADETGGIIWGYDAAKADAREIGTNELFGPVVKNGAMNYRKAFLYPPHTAAYTHSDFEKINAALFPKGKKNLEIFEWTTDWSEYFDEGHEWWGTLCITVYDKELDRFAVIMASATD